MAILTISMPIVQQSLLSLSKIGATMSWIDLRSKPKDVVRYINSSNCKTIIVFEDMLPLIESIIDETDVRKVVVSSPKDYLSPIVKVLATLKDKKDGKKIVLPDDSRFVRFNDFIKNVDTNNLITPASFEKDRPSLIVQSSGSTGKPKQIIHTEYNFNSAVQKMAFTMKAEMSPFVDENTVYNDLGKFDISLAAPLHYRYMYKQLIELNKSITELEKDNSLEAKKN